MRALMSPPAPNRTVSRYQATSQGDPLRGAWRLWRNVMSRLNQDDAASFFVRFAGRVPRMRFAIKTRPEHQTWEEIRDAWIAADEIPLFESAWNWDHFYPLTGDLTGPNFEAWTMLGAMSQATRRIRIGCQVTGMIYRHPAVLANMAATVDIISGGRLELGLGAGWNQMECDAYGIDLPPLRERFDRFDEGVEAIVRLLTQPTTTFDGKYVKLANARCEPKAVQHPHPPIVIGGRGKTRTLRTTARWAQQWNAITQDPSDWLSLK